MKILFHIPFSTIGETEKNVQNLINHLPKNYEVMVTYEHAEIGDKIRTPDIIIQRVFSPNTLAAAIIRFKPDIIQFYDSNTAIMAIKKAQSQAKIIEVLRSTKYSPTVVPDYPRNLVDLIIGTSKDAVIPQFHESKIILNNTEKTVYEYVSTYNELLSIQGEAELPNVIGEPAHTASNLLIQRCVCGNNDFQEFEKYGLPLATCSWCGVIHQRLNMTKEEYFNFYEKEYPVNFQNENNRSTYKDRYDHDKKIAEMRLEKYSTFIPSKGRMLDIGASNGAFVHAAREANYDAYGVDMNEGEFIYKGPLENVNFPTEYFDIITIHDVLEHLIDPVTSLKEIRRVLKPGGRIVIDFPNYFEDSGKHHWKKIEHLWYLDKVQLKNFLEKEGLGVIEIDQPIPSKLVYYCYNTNTIASKVKILLLPGMGDIYWTLTKMESFLAAKNIYLPEVYIWNFDNRPRSHEFLQKFPFVRAMGYYNKPADHRVLKDTYTTGKTWVIPNYKEFDYYLSVNGILTDGKSLETIKEFETNWYVPMFEALDQRDFGKHFKEKNGNYIVSFFSELGMFAEWIKSIPIEEIYSMLKEINASTKSKIVLTGCEWDLDFNKKLLALDKSKIFIDMIGKTTNDQFFGLIKESKGFIGWCGGNTVMSVVLKIPTIIFWSNKHFKNEGFYTNCCPPEGVDKWYFPQVAERFNKKEVINIAKKVFK